MSPAAAAPFSPAVRPAPGRADRCVRFALASPQFGLHRGPASQPGGQPDRRRDHREMRNRRRSQLTQMLVPRLAARAKGCVSVAAAGCVRGMVVTSGSVVYGSLVVNVASTIRAVRLVGRADSRIDSLRLVKTLFATLGTSRHFAALYYHSVLGAVQKSAARKQYS